MLASYCTRLLGGLNPQTTRGAKKVHGVEGLRSVTDLWRRGPFRGGPRFPFYDSLIMNAARFDFSER